MARIKKAQLGADTTKIDWNNPYVKSANKSDTTGKRPSGLIMPSKKQIKKMPKYKPNKMKDGGSLGMKSVKAGFDKNPGVTKADIIVAAKKKARGGASIKAKGVSSSNVSKRLGSRLRAGGTLSPTSSNVTRRLSSPFKNKKARGGATLAPSKKSTSNRLASNLKMRNGGTKKAMGGYKMMMTGGKCRGGCY